MKYKEIMEKNSNELGLLETKLRGELAELWIQARAGQLAQSHKIGDLRRDIAKILTAKKAKKGTSQ